jgi:2-polyprenyl-3-methyl-5-hydroxy-6-metoxy-1,4-benzoquinol methylase
MKSASERDLTLEEYLQNYIRENDTSIARRVAWGGTLQRYEWAAAQIGALAPEDRVFDLGCSLGFGSNILEQTGARVIGADFHEQAAMYAQMRYPQTRMRFLAGDALALPFRSGVFRAICTFEVLEHLPVDAVPRYLSEMRRVVQPGGVCILSTPNTLYTQAEGFGMYEYHEKEYAPDELRALLSGYFSKVDLYGQRYRYTRGSFKAVESKFSYSFIARIKRLVPVGLKNLIFSTLRLDQNIAQNWEVHPHDGEISWHLLAVCR